MRGLLLLPRANFVSLNVCVRNALAFLIILPFGHALFFVGLGLNQIVEEGACLYSLLLPLVNFSCLSPVGFIDRTPLMPRQC